jgi:hypothetical protein
MWMVPVKPELYFPKIQELFDGQGNLNADMAPLHEKAVTTAFNELVWMARALKIARSAS